MKKNKFSLFSVYGIEIEYMIVDEKTLAVKPITDQLIEKLHGEITDEFFMDDIGINNELALHVVELKTAKPVSSLKNLSQAFHTATQKLNKALKDFEAILLPTAAHPWLDPKQGIALWPHNNREIYAQYNRIFQCNGHGWGNLQSTHINLPFADTDEFVQLHEAIRLVLPLIPAIAASSPIIENKLTGIVDNRLVYYGKNQRAIKEIAGQIIPESVTSIDDYHHSILQPMYRAIAPQDPQGILQDEWLNSRGAIARFERYAIEIRVMDNQECAKADIALVDAICAVTQWLVDNHNHRQPGAIATEDLVTIYQGSMTQGLDFVVENKAYLQCLSSNAQAPMTLREIWQTLLSTTEKYLDEDSKKITKAILTTGNLSQRITAAHKQQNRTQEEIYRTLAQCLNNNQLFLIDEAC